MSGRRVPQKVSLRSGRPVRRALILKKKEGFAIFLTAGQPGAIIEDTAGRQAKARGWPSGCVFLGSDGKARNVTLVSSRNKLVGRIFHPARSWADGKSGPPSSPWMLPFHLAAMLNLGEVLALVAQRRPRTTGWEFPLFWASLPLIGILLGGALAIYLVDRWRKRRVRTFSDSSAQLAYFRKMCGQGKISQEEFEQVRARLTGQLQKEFQIPAPVPQTPETPPGPQEPPPDPSPGT
jgi:hypothetical protein